MITAIAIIAGLMLSSGLVVCHQLWVAPLGGDRATPRRNPRPAVAGRPRNRSIDPARSCRSSDPETRRMMKRLRREEKRQRPQEARN